MNSIRTSITAIASLLCMAATTSMFAADAGGRHIVSHKGDCQLTVPNDWKVDTVLKGSASAPGDTASAVISSDEDYKALAEIKPIIQLSLIPVKTIEDSPQRLWYQYKTDGQGTGWYVGVPGKGVICGAQIGFKHPAMADLAKKIALSVGPTP